MKDNLEDDNAAWKTSNKNSATGNSKTVYEEVIRDFNVQLIRLIFWNMIKKYENYYR